MKSIVTGILAHVDAGKTTLIEALLFKAGMIRQAGNVDKKTTQLDTDAQERERGITIYSKEAQLDWDGCSIQLMDTPGHADFSAEMEKSLDVLDGAVLLISGLDGVQAHTRTIWKLLKRKGIPVLLFVNKMDITHKTEEELLEDIKTNLDGMCDIPTDENIALSEDTLLEQYLETGNLTEEQKREAISTRKFFPVLFGSALKHQGIGELLDAMETFGQDRDETAAFGAVVSKVNADGAHVKVTSGTLENRQQTGDGQVTRLWTWKGAKPQSVQQVTAGQLCIVQGIEDLLPGQGLGIEQNRPAPTLSGNMEYEMLLPEGSDPLQIAPALSQLAKEDPTLNLETRNKSIHLSLMGPIQMEVLQKRMLELTGLEVSFGPGKPVYLETITEPVEGYGHFEPLRHYAEVHVRLEPADGIQIKSEVFPGTLSTKWQATILNALSTKRHKGTKLGAPMTDMRIVLTAAKAHLKHTSPGDMRQAATRAVRQALMKTETKVLEPSVKFTATVPEQNIGKVLFELEQAGAQAEINGNEITGTGPAAALAGFQTTIRAMTKGNGLWQAEPDGYTEVKEIPQTGYEPEGDLANPPGSVFCANGSGYQVSWDEVEEHLHIPIRQEAEATATRTTRQKSISEEEAKRAFAQISGRNRNEKKQVKPKKKKTGPEKQEIKFQKLKPVCLVVDGYNVLYDWHLKSREELISELQDYQGARDIRCVLVFDGWRQKENAGMQERKGALEIIYTRTGQSADAWIERFCADNKDAYRLEVATSDGAIQNSVLGHGARRLSARELKASIESKKARTKEIIKDLQSKAS